MTSRFTETLMTEQLCASFCLMFFLVILLFSIIRRDRIINWIVSGFELIILGILFIALVFILTPLTGTLIRPEIREWNMILIAFIGTMAVLIFIEAERTIHVMRRGRRKRSESIGLWGGVLMFVGLVFMLTPSYLCLIGLILMIYGAFLLSPLANDVVKG